MKVDVSIPDPIFEKGESLARRLSKTRSELYTQALDEYVTRHDPDTVVERINAVVDSLEEKEDHFVAQTAGSILSQVKW